jgi:uncharacterized protein (DUF4415 family)
MTMKKVRRRKVVRGTIKHDMEVTLDKRVIEAFQATGPGWKKRLTESLMQRIRTWEPI